MTQLGIRFDELSGSKWVFVKGGDDEMGMELSEGSQGGAALKQWHIKTHSFFFFFFVVFFKCSVSKHGTQMNRRG